MRRVHLPGDPYVEVLDLVRDVRRIAAQIGLVGKLGRVARVLVETHRHEILGAAVAPRHMEPRPVLHDRSAKGRVDVDQLLDLIGIGQPCSTQLLRDVVPRHRAVREGAKE